MLAYIKSSPAASPGKCPLCHLASRNLKDPSLVEKCSHTIPHSFAPPKPTASISTQLTSIFKKKESNRKTTGLDDYSKYMKMNNARKSSQLMLQTQQTGSPTTVRNSTSKTWWKKKSQQ